MHFSKGQFAQSMDDVVLFSNTSLKDRSGTIIPNPAVLQHRTLRRIYFLTHLYNEQL
jgi:hypothetical protein